MDPEIGSDMRDRPAALERQTDAALKQLLGVLPRSRHDSGESPLPRTASWFRGPRETRSGSVESLATRDGCQALSARRPPPYHALRSATSRNPGQRLWLVSAASAPIRVAIVCHRLRPQGSTKAPSFVVRRDDSGREEKEQ